MSKLYNIINSLCLQNNINVTFMCKELSISRSTLSELSSGRTKVLSSEILNKIASFFFVDSKFLLEEAESDNWNDCGWVFGVSSETFLDTHCKWKKATKKYGFCWNAKYRNAVKNDARFALALSNNSELETIHYNELIFKALFSRSLEGNNYSLDHITFSEYVGALLNQEQFKTSIPVSAYTKMVEKYGVNDLIKKGTYYGTDTNYENDDDFISENTINLNNASTNIELSDILSKLNDSSILNLKKIANILSNLNLEGQEKLVDYGDDLVMSQKYKKSNKNKVDA